MSRLHAVLGVTMILLISGCTTEGEAPPEPDPGTDSEPVVDNETVETPTVPVGMLTDGYFFEVDQVLAKAMPAEGAVVFEGGYRDLPSGLRPNLFVAPASEYPSVIALQSLPFEFWAQARTAPAASSGAFDYALWIGTDAMWPVGLIMNTGQTLQPGQTEHVQMEMGADGLRPFYLAPGESMEALLISGKAHEGQGYMQLLVGGETPSGLNFTRTFLEEDPLAKVSQTNTTVFEGTLSNAQVVACTSQEGVDHAFHSFTLGPDATMVMLRVERVSGGAAVVDIDLDLLESGTRIAGSHSPRSTEGVRLVGPAFTGLAGAQLEALVSVCVGDAVGYRLTVETDGAIEAS